MFFLNKKLIYRHDKCGNEDLSVSLSLWAFKEKGVLRVKSVNHHKNGEKKSPSAYTINEDIVREREKEVRI